MNYYFLVASLPAVSLQAPPAWSWEVFRAEAARHLSADALLELEAVAAGQAGRSVFSQAWAQHETQLRNAVARARASRREQDAAPHLRAHEGYRVALEHRVSEAFGKPNPLERERTLDEARWAHAEALALAVPFGLEAVLAYAIKLRIALRWAGLEDEVGRAALLAAVQGVRDAARSELEMVST